MKKITLGVIGILLLLVFSGCSSMESEERINQSSQETNDEQPPIDEIIEDDFISEDEFVEIGELI